MTGDAPQPGQTPRNETEPWSYTDPNTSWWRVEEERDQAEVMAEAASTRQRRPRRPSPTTVKGNVRPPTSGEPAAAFAPEALDAHAAGAQDVATELDPPPAAMVEAEQEAEIQNIEAAAAAEAVADAAEGYDVSKADDARNRDGADPAEESAPVANLPDLARRPGGVPDVMVLPEPNRNRPTVALDRGPVPGGPPPAPSRLGMTSLERLENSPFWLTDEERAAAEAAGSSAETRPRPADGPADGSRGRPPVAPRSPRRPVPGLIGLVALALIAAFFSWVSAEPFWLAVGHGDRGVATVGRCTGSGVTQRCSGSFAAADGRFAVERVTLLGVEAGSRTTGAVAPARMVSPDSRQVYVGAAGWLVHLRWVLGFVLVVLVGYGIAGMTGARQLETASARRGAVLISLAGPILLLAGFLAAAY